MNDAAGAASWGKRLGLTRGAVSAIATIVSVGVAISLMSPLVSLTLASRGVSERTIGLVISTYAVAMLIATPHTTRIAARLGTANAIVALTVAAALLIPLVWLIEDVAGLFPVMLLYGACVSLCFTLSEYWIASATPEGRRGFVIGLYSTLLSIGFAIGPAIIALLGTGSIAPFLIGSALMIAAAVPALRRARRIRPTSASGRRCASPHSSLLHPWPRSARSSSPWARAAASHSCRSGDSTSASGRAFPHFSSRR